MAPVLEPKKSKKTAKSIGEPTWEIAKFYPLQGNWTEEDYYALVNISGTLVGKAYKVHREYKPGKQAASKLLKGFTVDVTQVFAAGER